MAALDQPLPSADPLADRLEFETLIADTSASLFAASPDAVDRAVERALDKVRAFFQADRCGLLAVSVDHEVINVRLASYAEGVARVPTDVNLAPLFPWARRVAVVERAIVRVSTMADLPPEAEADRRAWDEDRVRSVLLLPIETVASIRHLIVLQAVFQEREWPDAFVTRLRVLGEMLVGALDRQSMLAELREAEQRVSLAADSAEAGLWTLDSVTGVFWVTNRTRAIFGFGPDECIDMARFRAAVHAEDWERVEDAVDRALRRLAPVDVEYRMFRGADRVMRWIASRGQLQSHATGASPRLMGYCIDVTERKRAEELVRLSEARLASAAELARLGFYEIDFEKGTAFFDDRLQEVLGIPPDRRERLGPLEFWVERLHPDDRQSVLAQRTRLHDGTVERLEAEYRFLHPTRGERWLHHVGRVTKRDVAGLALTSNGVLRDITERRRDEQALRRSYAQIKELKDRLQAESDYLKAEIGAGRLHGEITGQSPAIHHVLRQIEQVAATDATVLVLGETGTGKERVAQAIHRLSPRHHHVMVKVNCAALPAGLVESELFGREKGAFTGALTRQVGRFEIADGSTVFLDEIGELSLDLQSKLLRVIESGEFERLGSPKTIRVNVRLIAATNRDLVAAIREGRFREDLYYRLNVFPIRVPPLRERREDIPSLVWTLLSELNARMGKKITQVPRETMDALLRHAWPGNVRELRNVLEHAAIVASGTTLRIGALGDHAPDATSVRALAGIERAHILAVLEESGWRVKGPDGAAALLGLKPSTLRGRMAKLGIERPRTVKRARD